jgi:DNA/RNA endonuclease YhcR with UshA esterase domain
MNRVWFVAALSVVALAACDEASSPAPTPGTVVANVYVDEDISGTLSPGDDIPEGLSVALVSIEDGGVVQTQQVDADGVVTFADVAPGSYRVELEGTEPEGSTLSGSPTPTATVPYTGGTVEVDFRFVYFPGSVGGRVYRDDNADGNYDAGVDRPGANLWVVLILPLSGGDARIDSVQTDAEGLYEFPTLAPQEFKLEFEAVGTMDYGVEGATRTIVVAPATRLTYDVTFTGGPIVTIAEARAQPVGSGVTVRGFVVVPPGIFTSGTGGVNSEIWIQDATGGIAAFAVPSASAATIALGDELEVSGPTSTFSGQLQIGTSASPPVVTELAGSDVVEPRPTTPTEFVQRTAEGQLVVIGALRVTTVPTGTGAAFTVTGVLADGTTAQIRVASTATGLTRSSFTVGQSYFVTGVLTQFNGTSQIKPRYAGDVVLVEPVSTARAAAAADTVAITGVVTVAPNVFTSGTGGVNSEIWVQDASGGIAVFPVASTRTTIAVGDSVDVLGVRTAFGGQAQIGSSAALPLVVMERAGSAPVAPLAQTGAEIVSRAAEGQLVTTTLTVTTVPTGTGAAFTVFASHADGTTGIQIRAAGGNTGLTRSDFVVGQTYQITGILTQFNGTAQLKPRGDADVVQQ